MAKGQSKSGGGGKGKGPAPRTRLDCGRWRGENVMPREVFGAVEVAALVFYVQRYLPKTIAAGGRPGTGYDLRERRQLWGKVRRGMFRESGVRRTTKQATHRWSDILDRDQELLDLLGVEIPGLAPPRGKETATPSVAAVPLVQGVQDGSSEGASAGPTSEAQAAEETSGAGGASTEGVSAAGTDAAVVPPGSAVGDATVVADTVPLSKEEKRKLMAARARQRKREAIVAEYRRLVAREQEEEEEEESAALSAPGTSSAPPGSSAASQGGKRPPQVRSRGAAAGRHRQAATTPAASHRALRRRVHRLSLRTAHLERVNAKLAQELKDLRRKLDAHLANGKAHQRK